MKRFIFLIACTFSLTLLNCQQAKQNSVVETIAPEAFEQLLEKQTVQLVDVRTLEEFQEEHIEAAINMDFLAPSFIEEIDKLDKDQPVLIYCRSGKRSANSIEQFQQVGFKKIVNLDGGILNWKSEGFPVTSQ
ncbi:rhodanese-like domain-containing protein [Changchengzhania lutea]|uniref:rhodanese-like domain-containing protein n=1 Tax=Changchengzhania lutea TaxID=2049305 RepID=UPI00115EC38A|nr:rhodanese-like domain-containing protein [Changchengzhania lutea]